MSIKKKTVVFYAHMVIESLREEINKQKQDLRQKEEEIYQLKEKLRNCKLSK